MQPTLKKKRHSRSNSLIEKDVRAAHERAIVRLMEPIAQLVKAAGFSAADLYELYEIAAVRLELEAQTKHGSPRNISEISAVTGISRNKVSRILKAGMDSNVTPKTRSRQPANRILQAWSEKAKFREKNGDPANLDLYSKGISFDFLVKKNGAGVPTRAALDALIKADAVEIISGNLISMKTKNLCRISAEAHVLDSLVESLWSVMDAFVKAVMAPSGARFFSGEYRIPMFLSTRRQIQKDLLASGFRMISHKDANAIETHGEEVLESENARPESFLTLFCHERRDGSVKIKMSNQKRSNYKRIV